VPTARVIEVTASAVAFDVGAGSYPFTMASN